MVRLHLVELDYYKILEPLKGATNLNYFPQKIFLVAAAIWERISKTMKLTKIFRAKRPASLPGKRRNMLIHELQTRNFHR